MACMTVCTGVWHGLLTVCTCVRGMACMCVCVQVWGMPVVVYDSVYRCEAWSA